MKKCIKAVSAIAMLLMAISLAPISISAADQAIIASDGNAIVGNGMPGVAIVASYDENGTLKKFETKPVKEGGIAKFSVAKGDKVMFWDGLDTMNPLADAVTVTEDKGNNSRIYNKAIYEKAVQNALYEALGKNKGSDMTQLQKAVALHDWLVVNCQYDVNVNRTYCHSKYGAIVEGYAVCDGYAKAYNDLLSRVGVKATYVEGYKPLRLGGKPEPHAWSCVTIDGKKYYVDATADDPVDDVPGRVSRSHFLVSYEVLQRDDYKGYDTSINDKTYDHNDIFHSFSMPFIWNEDLGRFYYINVDEVKTTADFTETVIPSSKENGYNPTSYAMTDDGKYICFFKPYPPYTDQIILRIYNFETGDYYNHIVSGISGILYCRVSQNGNNMEIVRDYYVNGLCAFFKAEASVPIPTNTKRRYVTFDQNYDGGKTTSCEYIDNYWMNGDGSFDEPKRYDYTFGGWYTKKDGGTRVENFEEIPGDNVTLYAHWWGDWSISEDPTLTKSGKAIRKLEGYPNVTEEITIPNLSDTSVWEKRNTVESTTEREGYVIYKSKYGIVKLILPKKDLEYAISYKKDKVWVTVIETDSYTITFESGGNTASRQMKLYGVGNYAISYPDGFTPSGKLTVTLYDGQNNKICTAQFNV